MSSLLAMGSYIAWLLYLDHYALHLLDAVYHSPLHPLRQARFNRSIQLGTRSPQMPSLIFLMCTWRLVGKLKRQARGPRKYIEPEEPCIEPPLEVPLWNESI